MSAENQNGGLWRPANSTEGEDFECNWCRHCRSDEGENWEDEFGNDVPGVCVIRAQALWGGQPDEWVRRDGMPWCLAFTQDPNKPARCLFTKEMDV